MTLLTRLKAGTSRSVLLTLPPLAGAQYASMNTAPLRTTATTKRKYDKRKVGFYVSQKRNQRIVHSHTRRYFIQLLVNHQLKRIIIQYSHRCINVSRPFVGELHGVCRAPGMRVMPAGNSDTGRKTVHFSSPSQQTTLVPESTPPNSDTTSTTACSAVVNAKYCLCNHLNWVDESHEFTNFLEQVHYFEDMSKCSENCQGVKGSLARRVAYWEKNRG